MLEEMYVYINIARTGVWAFSWSITTRSIPNWCPVVRDGDAVLMPAGYHSQRGIPGYRIGFPWAIGGAPGEGDRQFGVVNVQPSFSGKGSGLEASGKNFDTSA